MSPWRHFFEVIFSPEHRPELIGSFFPLLVFIPGTLVALFSPQLAKYIWFLGFGGLFVRRFHRPSPDRTP